MAKKISDLLIGLLIVSIFTAGISLILAVGSAQYNTSYDNTTFNDMNYLSSIKNVSADLENSTANIQPSQSNGFDVIGTLFNQAIGAISLTSASFGYMTNLVYSASHMLGLSGPFVPVLITAILVIISITIIFILLRPVVKDQL
jgi:hypothetical protein